MSNAHVREPFQSLLRDIREATHTLQRCAVKGATMHDTDPEYRTSEQEKDAEIAEQARIIADLDSALQEIADIAGDHGDGAPDDHPLAHIMLQLEAIAKDALDEARGTHRKALEAMQKRQQP